MLHLSHQRAWGVMPAALARSASSCSKSTLYLSYRLQNNKFAHMKPSYFLYLYLWILADCSRVFRGRSPCSISYSRTTPTIWTWKHFLNYQTGFLFFLIFGKPWSDIISPHQSLEREHFSFSIRLFSFQHLYTPNRYFFIRLFNNSKPRVDTFPLAQQSLENFS